MTHRLYVMSLLGRYCIIRRENEAIKGIRAAITHHENTALLAITDAYLCHAELEANNLICHNRQ